MPKTRLDVVNRALREIGVASIDVNAEADELAYTGDTLDSVFAELTGIQGATITWTLAEVPDAAFLPLSELVAAHIAPHYMVAYKTHAQAMGRMRSYLFLDDREDSRDLDKDGTISEAEEAAGLRAQYY